MAEPVLRARVSQSQYDLVKEFARSDGSTVSDVVRRAVAQYIDGFNGGRQVVPLGQDPAQIIAAARAVAHDR